MPVCPVLSPAALLHVSCECSCLRPSKGKCPSVDRASEPNRPSGQVHALCLVSIQYRRLKLHPGTLRIRVPPCTTEPFSDPSISQPFLTVTICNSVFHCAVQYVSISEKIIQKPKPANFPFCPTPSLRNHILGNDYNDKLNFFL